MLKEDFPRIFSNSTQKNLKLEEFRGRAWLGVGMEIMLEKGMGKNQWQRKFCQPFIIVN